MQFNELLQAFNEMLGGGVELTPDESGAVVLDVDGMTVSIIGMEDVGFVALLGVVGEPPPEEKMERLYRAMLEANHNFAGTAGSTLSINSETGEINLCRMLECVAIDGNRFFSEVEHFVNTLETWRKIVADFRGTVGGDDAPSADEPAGPLGGDLGMMRI